LWSHPLFRRNNMSTKTTTRSLCVILVGNPNTGKSTLFNALSGLRQRVGNFPGTTVEKKVGRLRFDEDDHVLIDLPGTYSLAPRSPDEVLAVDVLLGRRPGTPPPDVILCVVDASNLARNMYLVSQLMELETRLVIALNMVDVATANGIHADAQALSLQLGVPVVPINARRNQGLDGLKRALRDARQPQDCRGRFVPPTVRDELDRLRDRADSDELPTFLVERVLLDDAGHLMAAVQRGLPPELATAVAEARQRCAGSTVDGSLSEAEARARYRWIDDRLRGVVRTTGEAPRSLTDRVDRILLHPWLGWLFLATTLLVLFQSIFLIAEPASNVIDAFTGWLSTLVSAVVPAGVLQSLLTDGLIEGVGGVLVFVPQIFLLFFFLALLEDSGYLARMACLMDRLMSRVGLSGTSFIPLLSSFACAIPGIMATRVIADWRDRLVTILIAPLMSCSARLPVYVLLIAAFIPQQTVLGGLIGLQGLTMFAMYALGIVVAVGVALVLRKTLFRGETPPFLMELPTYKCPSAAVVLHRTWDGGWSFIQGAGTLIVAVAVLVWAAAYFPRSETAVDPQLLARQEALRAQLVNVEEAGAAAEAASRPSAGSQHDRLRAELANVEASINAGRLRHSFLGRAGQWIEPIVKPLGWDWRIGCAVIASFPAREVVVATLAVLYKLGGEADEESESLRQTLREATWDNSSRPVFTIPVALSLMVFFALCAQCMSTLAIMRRETNSWRWPAFVFTYMTLLAYVGAWITYHAATSLAG
jgi:ferrous iron transport protein B